MEEMNDQEARPKKLKSKKRKYLTILGLIFVVFLFLCVFAEAVRLHTLKECHERESPLVIGSYTCVRVIEDGEIQTDIDETLILEENHVGYLEHGESSHRTKIWWGKYGETILLTLWDSDSDYYGKIQGNVIVINFTKSVNTYVSDEILNSPAAD